MTVIKADPKTNSAGNPRDEWLKDLATQILTDGTGVDRLTMDRVTTSVMMANLTSVLRNTLGVVAVAAPTKEVALEFIESASDVMALAKASVLEDLDEKRESYAEVVAAAESKAGSSIH